MVKPNSECNPDYSKKDHWYAIIPADELDSDVFLDVFYSRKSAEKVLDKWMEWGRWRWDTFQIISYPRWKLCKLQPIEEETIVQMRERRTQARHDFQLFGSKHQTELTRNTSDLTPKRPPATTPEEVISKEERRKKPPSEDE